MNKTDLKKMNKDTLIEELIKCENGTDILISEIEERSHDLEKLQAEAYKDGYEAGINENNIELATCKASKPAYGEDAYFNGLQAGKKEVKKSLNHKIKRALFVLMLIIVVPVILVMVVGFITGGIIGIRGYSLYTQEGLCMSVDMQEPVDCAFTTEL